jgi:hypothetical protein
MQLTLRSRKFPQMLLMVLSLLRLPDLVKEWSRSPIVRTLPMKHGLFLIINICGVTNLLY